MKLIYIYIHTFKKMYIHIYSHDTIQKSSSIHTFKIRLIPQMFHLQVLLSGVLEAVHPSLACRSHLPRRCVGAGGKATIRQLIGRACRISRIGSVGKKQRGSVEVSRLEY